MVLATTTGWLNAKTSLIFDYMEKNLLVYVIDVTHVCETDMSLELFLKSRSPPIKCVLIEQDMRQEVYKLNMSLLDEKDDVFIGWARIVPNKSSSQYHVN